MNDFVTVKRKDDIVISVFQDNEEKVVKISDLNQAAENLLEYSKDELVNEPLVYILSKKVANCINDYLDYTNNNQDLSDVLSKIIDFCLVSKTGQNIRVKVKIFRTAQLVYSRVSYELLIRNISNLHQLNIFRNQYLEHVNKKYKYHSSLNILDNYSSILELEVMLKFASKYKINLVVGIMSLDFVKSDNTEIVFGIIVEYFYKNSRSDDFLGYIDYEKMIFVLVKCSPSDSQQVVERLHSAINKQLLERNLQTISIGYTNIDFEVNIIELFRKINTALSYTQRDGGNTTKFVRYS
ncbi:hypothetical protein [Wolbachia endosymbiont of Pentidionis agamae]|uniref:hypothetical protein n=1 Tax=Wolbachia endosymbiont of Pentidionis agamae TaxID=3110435 RepID=UPI002FD12AF9